MFQIYDEILKTNIWNFTTQQLNCIPFGQTTFGQTGVQPPTNRFYPTCATLSNHKTGLNYAAKLIIQKLSTHSLSAPLFTQSLATCASANSCHGRPVFSHRLVATNIPRDVHIFQ